VELLLNTEPQKPAHQRPAPTPTPQARPKATKASLDEQRRLLVVKGYPEVAVSQMSAEKIPRLFPEDHEKGRPESLAALFRIAASWARTDSVEYLCRNRHAALLTICRYVLNLEIQFNVTAPAYYRPASLPEHSLSLYQESRRLYLFCNDPQRPSPLANDPAKRQRRFEDMLNALLADEAELRNRQEVAANRPHDPGRGVS
jgi:hypothetical protein